MQVKSMLASVGLGMVAGAAAVLMLPRHSEAYRMADDAAHAIKKEASDMMNRMRS